MVKPEQASFLKTPEFEQGCNLFIRDLPLNVYPSYPTLRIQAINLMPFFANNNDPETIKYLLKHFDISERAFSLEPIGNAVNEISSFVSLAFVTISPEKGIEPLSLIKVAVSDIDRLAQIHGGRRSLTNTKWSITGAPLYPATIGYEFLSKSFKKEHSLD